MRPDAPAALNKITIPFKMSDFPSVPFTPKGKHAWTEKERGKASMATFVQNIDSFSNLVLILYYPII